MSETPDANNPVTDVPESPLEGERDINTPPNNSPPKDIAHIVKSYEDVVHPETLATRIRDFYMDGVGAFDENRRMHSEDLNFVYNSETQAQWDPTVLEARRGKPCYTFNRVLGPVNLVIADMRQTRPNGEVRAANEQANEATAEVFEGLMRSIEQESRAPQVYKNQFKFSVAGGFGAWQLVPEYVNHNSFNQRLRIKDIPNPQTVVWDPECNDPCAGDANKAIVAERISKDSYIAKWGEPGTSFNFARDSYGWFTDKEVRIADYYERVPFEKEIALLSDGRVEDVTDELLEADAHWEVQGMDQMQGVARIVRRRKVREFRVLWAKCDGTKILEGPIFYDWKRIPVVRCPGRYVNIEGRKKLQSLIRHSKDAQRSYNSRVSDMIERSSLTPKAPYLVTANMIKGYETAWQQANVQSRPFLPFNVDPDAVKAGSSGIPQRTAPIDMPMGALALAQSAAADIQATTGFFDPALGNAEEMNRVSGKALVQHTRRSDLGSFEFIDGYAAALQLTWEMGIDMIRTIYDTKQVVRIIGKDAIERMVAINDNDADVLHDLTVGQYDCIVTVGPSFQSQRQEALETLIEAAGVIPAMANLAPDLIAKNIDNPDAAELTRRLRIGLIMQGIVKPTDAEKAQLPPPPQPNPVEQAQQERQISLAAKDHANALLAQMKLQNTSQLGTHREIIEMAGKHLANLLLAQQLGQPNAASEAESSQGTQPTTA